MTYKACSLVLSFALTSPSNRLLIRCIGLVKKGNDMEKLENKEEKNVDSNHSVIVFVLGLILLCWFVVVFISDPLNAMDIFLKMKGVY